MNVGGKPIEGVTGVRTCRRHRSRTGEEANTAIARRWKPRDITCHRKSGTIMTLERPCKQGNDIYTDFQCTGQYEKLKDVHSQLCCIVVYLLNLNPNSILLLIHMLLIHECTTLLRL